MHRLINVALFLSIISLVNAETIPVLVFGGQSLAICSGTDTGLLPTNSPLLVPQTNVLFFNARTHAYTTNHWAIYQAPTGPGFIDSGHTNAAGSFGPEAVAADLIFRNYGSRVAVFKYAIGSAGMYNHWLPDRYAYADMTNRLAEALTKLQLEYGVTGRVVGIFWTQGESDALDGANYASAYGRNLVKFVTAWRCNLGYRVPFVYSQILPQWPNSSIVREGQRNLTNFLADVRMVDMDDYPTPTKHWNNEGTIAAGERYARAFNGIISRRNSVEIATASDGVKLNIYGPPDHPLTVLWSQDFVSWHPMIETRTDLSGTVTLTDNSTPIGIRFYKVSW